MNANYKSIILALSLFFALSASISAAPGDLDLTFGSGGIVITRDSFQYSFDYALGMAIQSDGKIVVVGEGSAGTFNWDFAVVRYSPDGSLDTSFGGSGIVITPLTSAYDGARSVAIKADGKIVVAGCVFDGAGGSSFGVVRYNPNGTLDTSFNGTGKVITSVGNFPGCATSVAIQADSKIVVAGSSGNGLNSDFAIVRYNTDGSLDSTFNGTGKVITQAGGGANSVAIQSDGKIIAAGGSQNGFTLVRYNTDGTLDTSFNGTGTVITSAGNSSGANSVAIQTDGKIVVAGSSFESSVGSRFAFARYNPNGSLDTSFGGTGIIIIPVGNDSSGAASVAIQSDGKIVAAGSVGDLTGIDFAVVRLNPNGSPDTTFNGTGRVITSIDMRDIASSAAIQADGKIVVAGFADNGSDFFDYVVVRYQGDGATPAACPNPIDCADFFVRQHYLDFLNREPDAFGLAFWTNEITSCGADAQCVEVKRVNVSAAFFLSIEFQETGYFVHRLYKAAYGDMPGAPVPLTRQEFLPDTQHIGQGVVVGASGWEQALENNKNTFASDFVARTRFTTTFPQGITSEQFVDALNANAGGVLSQGERDQFVSELASGTKTRAQVLRSVAENSTLAQQEFNKAFVLMQYFGYLCRNPNDLPDTSFSGFSFWLDKLNQFNSNFVEAEMVEAFITSGEYRQRFAQP